MRSFYFFWLRAQTSKDAELLAELKKINRRD